MQVAGRNLGLIAKSALDRRHYVAAANMVRVYEHPAEMFKRYLIGKGTYPYTVRVRTPESWLDLRLHSGHDLLTVNEIFCRKDYLADASDTVIVDFGSNIGISAAYFLTRNATAYTYLFEPLPTNVAKLKENLRPFEGRYEVREAAVGTSDGEVEFAWEESGRYGGVGAPHGNTLTVPLVNSRTVLEDVIAKHGKIDILKIDIEGLEAAVIENIPVEQARKIKKLYVEYTFDTNPLAETHDYYDYGAIAQFTRKAV
jgi:FkbM family methyltransferase